jgi:hypothetical protein
MEASLK